MMAFSLHVKLIDAEEKNKTNVAYSLRLDLCRGCSLKAAGISARWPTVAENYLQRRRDASNPITSIDYVQTDSKARMWRPGLNELGLTMCSACGPNGKLFTSG